MSGIATAIVGGAIIGGIAMNSAAGKAADATTSATNASIAEQDKALAQQAALSEPYRNLGTSNIQTYQDLLTGGSGSKPLNYADWIAQQGPQAGGGGGPDGATPFPQRAPMSVDGVPMARAMVGGARMDSGGGMIPRGAGATGGASQAAYQQYLKNFKPTGGGAAGIQQTLESLPGYQFTRDQGIEAAKRANPNLSGNQVVGATEFASNLANTTYAQRLQELLAPIQIGQAAAAGQAANVGSAAGNISGALINQGNTSAGIDANTAAGISKLAGNVGSQLLTYNTIQGLNNPGSGGTGGPIAPVPSFTPDPSTFTYTPPPG